MNILRWIMVFTLVSLSGCTAMAEKDWKAWPAMQREKPVALLLVVDSEAGVPQHASEFFFTTLPELMANSGYYALPPSFSYQLLRDSGYKQVASVLNAEPGAIQKLTGADAVLYVRVKEWQASTSIFATGSVRVAASYQLISTKTGTLMWHADSYHEMDTSVDEGSWLEDMVLTELETSSADISQVAQQLNESVLYLLPPGKYHPFYQNWQQP